MIYYITQYVRRQAARSRPSGLPPVSVGLGLVCVAVGSSFPFPIRGNHLSNTTRLRHAMIRWTLIMQQKKAVREKSNKQTKSRTPSFRSRAEAQNENKFAAKEQFYKAGLNPPPWSFPKQRIARAKETWGGLWKAEDKDNPEFQRCRMEPVVAGDIQDHTAAARCPLSHRAAGHTGWGHARVSWMFLRSHMISWVLLDPHGYSLVLMDPHGYSWILRDPCGYLCIIDTHGYSQIIGSDRFSWILMDPYVIV